MRNGFVAGLVLVCISCQPSKDQKDQPKSEKKEAAATPVPVARVERSNISRSMTLQAEFQPYEEVELYAKVAGYLKDIKVDVGDRVTKGQLIATLEIPEMVEDVELAGVNRARTEADVQRAKAQLEQAQATESMAHLAYQRLKAVSVSRPNLIAQSEIDDALARDRAAEANISAAKAGLASAEQQSRAAASGETRTKTMEAYSRLTAPFSGLITKRYAHPGAMIQAGTASQTQAMPVVRLSQDDRLRLVVATPESLVGQLRVGTKVGVRVLSLKQVFDGTIARSSGRVQSMSRTMDIEIDVLNKSHVLKPGMTAEADFVAESKTDTLVVPLQAVIDLTSNPRVFIVNDKNRIESHAVKTGLEAPDRVELLSGVEEGQTVITSGQARLRVGQVVAPKAAAKSAVGGGGK